MIARRPRGASNVSAVLHALNLPICPNAQTDAARLGVHHCAVPGDRAARLHGDAGDPLAIRMRKRDGYKAGATGKIAAVILIGALVWAAWEFGLLEAIADLSTMPLAPNTLN